MYYYILRFFKHPNEVYKIAREDLVWLLLTSPHTTSWPKLSPPRGDLLKDAISVTKLPVRSVLFTIPKFLTNSSYTVTHTYIYNFQYLNIIIYLCYIYTIHIMKSIIII